MTWDPKRWTHRHQQVLMHLLAHPGHRSRQIGAATGYSPDHVLHLMRSPKFRRRYQALRVEVESMILEHYLATIREPVAHNRELRSADEAIAFLARRGAPLATTTRQRRRRRSS